MLCVGLVVNVNYIFGNKDYKYKNDNMDYILLQN
jgi:hypothetical protein